MLFIVSDKTILERQLLKILLEIRIAESDRTSLTVYLAGIKRPLGDSNVVIRFALN